MRLYRRIKGVNQIYNEGSVVTIGVFDGLHLGHQVLINRAIEKASELSLPSVVFSFEPTPNDYFAKNEKQLRLNSFRQKYNLIKAMGVNSFYVPPFDSKMEELDVNEFIDLHLLKNLNVKHLIVGDDFRFAKNKAGSIKELEESAKINNFTVESISTVEINSKRVSSTLIRTLLFDNQLEVVNEYLGRNYCIEGKVITGQQLGRTIGVPTANIAIGKLNNPLRGVYCVKVVIENDDQAYFGVANIGYKPTVEGKTLNLEVHILNFDQDIYKSRIQVEFMRYLRGEKKFNGVDELKAQINLDIKESKKYFKELGK